MKLALLALAAVTLAVPAMAKDVYVHGYTTKSGTYVSPYHRSSPDSTKTNNYSYPGNTNPYTGVTAPSPYGIPALPKLGLPPLSSYDTTPTTETDEPSSYDPN